MIARTTGGGTQVRGCATSEPARGAAGTDGEAGMTRAGGISALCAHETEPLIMVYSGHAHDVVVVPCSSALTRTDGAMGAAPGTPKNDRCYRGTESQHGTAGTGGGWILGAAPPT